MSQISLATIPRQAIADPYVSRFVNEVTDLLKLEVLQSLGHAKDERAVPVKQSKIKVGKTPKEYSTVGMTFTQHLNSKPSTYKKRVLDRSVTPSVFTPQLNTLRAGLNIDYKSIKPVHQQVNLASKFSFFNETYSNRIIRVINDHLDDVSGAGNGGGNTIVTNKGLKFRLHEVKCVDETDPEMFGSDEIALGGASVDDEETVKKISQFKVGNFDDGDRKQYNPVKVLSSFDLSNGTYPKTFGVFVSIAEKDNHQG